MAILGLFECQLLVDGKALSEYDDDDNDGGEHPAEQNIMKYIEAESGANFEIRLSIKPGLSFGKSDYLSACIMIDGEWKGSPVVSKKSYKISKSKAYIVTAAGSKYGASTGWFLRKFRFGEIKTGETPASGSSEILDTNYHELGLVKVKFWRCKVSSIGKDLERSEYKPVEVVPEKALKGRALNLATSLDEAEAIQVGNAFKGKKTDDKPMAEFKFKYRSKESLKQLLIIPRTPSPTPLEERALENLSIEEAREVIRRQKAEAEATRARMKKERTDSNLDTPRAVKRSREDMGINEDDKVEAIAGRSAYKRYRSSAGQEVIELSD